MAEGTPLWEVKKEQGNVAFRNNQFEEAIARYTEAIEENQAVPMLYSNRSAAYLKKGMYEEAVRDASKAIASDPLFVKAYPRLHTALCNQGKFTDAARWMSKGAESLRAGGHPSPSQAEDIRSLETLEKQAAQIQRNLDDARKAIAEGSHQAAERLLIEPARCFPECPAVIFLFAEARVSTAPDEVNRSLSSFARTHNNDAHYLYVKALATYYRGQDGLKNTLQILRSALELDPDFMPAQSLLRKIRNLESSKESGNASFRAKKFKEAIDFYTAAIDVDSTNKRMNAILRGNRAAARMELKDLQGALLDCNFAIANGNESAKMIARRGRIYEAMEKWEDAVRDLEKAAELDAEYQQELNATKVRAKRANKKDFYKILDVPNNCDDSALKKAYRLKCLQWHPDKWAHSSDEEKAIAESKFKEVGEAFSLLSDPRKRQMYDSGQIDNETDAQTGGMGGGGAGPSQEDMMRMFNMMFQGGGMGGDPFGGGGRSSGGRQRRQQGGMPPGFSFSFQ